MKKKGIIGGAIGLLAIVLAIIVRVFGAPLYGLSIIQFVLFGLLVGIISQQFIPKTTEKTILKNTGIAFLVILFTYIIIEIIVRVISRIFGRFDFTLLSGFIPGLIISTICSISIFVFLKLSQKKGLLPAGEETLSENSEMQNQSQNIPTSKFDGGVFELIGINIFGTLLTMITLGICLPVYLCWLYKWEINHTIIEGRRLKFSGRAIGLFGTWLKCWILSIITLGIYGLWVPITLNKWKVKNISFAE